MCKAICTSICGFVDARTQRSIAWIIYMSTNLTICPSCLCNHEFMSLYKLSNINLFCLPLNLKYFSNSIILIKVKYFYSRNINFSQSHFTLTDLLKFIEMLILLSSSGDFHCPIYSSAERIDRWYICQLNWSISSIGPFSWRTYRAAEFSRRRRNNINKECYLIFKSLLSNKNWTV